MCSGSPDSGVVQCHYDRLGTDRHTHFQHVAADFDLRTSQEIRDFRVHVVTEGHQRNQSADDARHRLSRFRFFSYKLRLDGDLTADIGNHQCSMLGVTQDVGFKTTVLIVIYEAFGVHSGLNEAALCREYEQCAIVALRARDFPTVVEKRFQLIFIARRDQLVLHGEAEIALFVYAVDIYVDIVKKKNRFMATSTLFSLWFVLGRVIGPMAPKIANNMKMKPVTDKEHLIDLADGWLLWKTLCLRGAGFPIHMLEAFAANDSVAEIDRFLDLELEWNEARDRALQACRDATSPLEPEARKPYRRAIRLLTKGRVPEPIPGSTETATMFATLALASKERDAARHRAEDSITEARRRISANLQDICHNSLLREAIIWQNRQVLQDSVDVIARMDVDGQNRYRRRHEESPT